MDPDSIYTIYTRPLNYFGHPKCKFIIKEHGDEVSEQKYYWYQIIQKNIIEVKEIYQTHKQYKNRCNKGSGRMSDDEYIKNIDHEEKDIIYEVRGSELLINVLYYINSINLDPVVINFKDYAFSKYIRTLICQMISGGNLYKMSFDCNINLFENSDKNIFKENKKSHLYYVDQEDKKIYEICFMMSNGPAR